MRHPPGRDEKVPEKKVTAAALAGAVVTIVVWILRATAHVEIPAEVSAAATVVLSAVAGYLAPHTHRPELTPAPPAKEAPAA